MHSRIKRLSCLLLIALSLTLSCQPRYFWWRQPPESFPLLLRKWTQTGKVYHGMNTILLVSATYMHSDVRRAFIKQYIEDLHLTPQEQEKLAQEQKADAEKGLQFIVAIFSDEEDWQKLEKDDTIWKVSLAGSGGLRVEPISVEHMKEVPIYLKSYYPFIAQFKRVYKITFPNTCQNLPVIDEQKCRFSLEFASAVAQLKIDWDFLEKPLE
ncbi:MAG: hypothetical protein HZA78_07895 [Candidatus Schekmanbacteria bacterium]|nr:hypothetical protein [Candidatus Schekmanbacteria bacterium]